MSSELTYTLASVPDRGDLVAEVWCGDEMFAEITGKNGSLSVEIYPRSNGAVWQFRFEELEDVLHTAASRLAAKNAS